MVLANDFLKAVAERFAEILVCGEDIAGEVELDDRLRFRQCRDDMV